MFGKELGRSREDYGIGRHFRDCRLKGRTHIAALVGRDCGRYLRKEKLWNKDYRRITRDWSWIRTHRWGRS